jgi:hypothetical protein
LFTFRAIPARNVNVGYAMQALSKVLLLLAALDSAVMGALALIVPSLLFHFLQIPNNNDGLLLCRLLGVLFLAHCPFLFLAARQPRVSGGLTLAPLFGRMLSCGVWLWLLNSDRTPADHATPLVLLIHDAVWLPIFAGFLWHRSKITPETPSSPHRLND